MNNSLSCSVKLPISIYIVCTLSALIFWVTILSTFLLVLQLASAVAQNVKAQAAFHLTYPKLWKSSHWPTCSLTHKLLVRAALGDWSPSAITCQANTTHKKTLLITKTSTINFSFVSDTFMMTSLLDVNGTKYHATITSHTHGHCSPGHTHGSVINVSTVYTCSARHSCHAEQKASSNSHQNLWTYLSATNQSCKNMFIIEQITDAHPHLWNRSFLLNLLDRCSTIHTAAEETCSWKLCLSSAALQTASHCSSLFYKAASKQLSS